MNHLIRLIIGAAVIIGVGFVIIWLVMPAHTGTAGTGTVPVVSGGTVVTSTSTVIQEKPGPTSHLQAKGAVQGTVTLSPTCPVQREPADPACAPKPYQTTIRIESPDSLVPLETISTDASGAFRIALPQGTYTFKAHAESKTPPTCAPVQVNVSTGQTQTISIDCDSGIR
jgi:hypothetical protein